MSLGVSTSALAKRNKRGPTQVVPPKKGKAKSKDEPTELSRGGERRGITELVLGSVATATGAALLGRGIWEIGVGRRVARECANGESTDVACNRPNPGNGGYIAAGLSFGFAVPFAVAGGLLLARGAKVNRAYKTWKKQHGAVAVTANGRGAGVSLSFRF